LKPGSSKGKGPSNAILTGLAVFILVLVSSTGLSAQTATDLDASGNLRLSISGSTFYQPKTHVSGGGDITVGSYRISANGLIPINDRFSFGLGLAYEFDDYNFSGLTGFAVPDPWNKIQRVGLSPRLVYKLQQDWNLSFSPIVQYAGEQGAAFDKSLVYGGAMSAMHRVNRNLFVGLGAGVFYRLGETRLFPSLMVSWRITDQLRFGNSNRLGPSGPAGLELAYTLDKNWEVSVGGGYRSNRFRLDHNGTTPDGIGQNATVPVCARIGRKLGQDFHLDLYGGAALGGSLRLEDKNGNGIDSVHYNTAPIMGLTLSSFF